MKVVSAGMHDWRRRAVRAAIDDVTGKTAGWSSLRQATHRVRSAVTVGPSPFFSRGDETRAANAGRHVVKPSALTALPARRRCAFSETPARVLMQVDGQALDVGIEGRRVPLDGAVTAFSEPRWAQRRGCQENAARTEAANEAAGRHREPFRKR